MKKINFKSNKVLSKEWDNIADLRYNQIETNKDISYNYVLCPFLIDISKKCDLSNMLDVGCGIGNFSKKMSYYSQKVTAIDISKKNIEIALQKYGSNNISYINISVEDYAKLKNNKFSLIISNMFLMISIDLSNTLKSISNLLKKNGVFIFSITHPCYWPIYWNYNNKKWFNYNNEIIIESKFKISLDQNNKHISTHVHRPLSKYINELTKYFIIENIFEPIPNKKIQKMYPKKWEFPRFLIAKCILK